MFYGNTTNTTNIAFQFDKIYETRYAMDQAIYGNNLLNIKRDFIAPGRYVLVSYGYDKSLNNNLGTVTTEDDFVTVYSNSIDQDAGNKTNSIGYVDGVYFTPETGTFYADPDCQHIIKLAIFSPVGVSQQTFEAPENKGKYYICRNNFYFRANSYQPDETYYESDISEDEADGQYVAKGQIVRRVSNNTEANIPYTVEYEYHLTEDIAIHSSKDYYIWNASSQNYERVAIPNASNLSNYYERDEETKTVINSSNKRRNGYTEEFFICVGTARENDSIYVSGYARAAQLYNSHPDDNPYIGAAGFKPLVLFNGSANNVELDYMDEYKEYTTPYLEHYNIDYAHYYNIDKTWGTLHRGYDATVWQKVVGEGLERYILIAHLNSLFPGLEVVNEPPTVEPLSPFIGKESTDMIARLHIQAPWGFEVKSYDTSTMTENQLERANFESDETTLVRRYVYEKEVDNEGNPTDMFKIVDGNLVHKLDKNGNYVIEEREEPAYIYYNKAGLDREIHGDVSDNNDNYISISPTGKSLGFDTKYKTSQLRTKAKANYDIQQLDIHLPAIGNMVSEGYDLIYGDGQEPNNLEHKRHLDTEWYNASETLFIEQGDASTYSGGKTFDLNTLAGSLNTYHNRLGQIIETLDAEDWPQDINDFEALNSNYIYKYGDEYYKLGNSYSDQDIEYSYYQCNYRKTSDTVLVQGKTYYIAQGGEFVPVNNPVAGSLSSYFEWFSEVNEDTWAAGTYYTEANENNMNDTRRIHPQIEYLNTRKYLVPFYNDEFDPGATYFKRHLNKSSWYTQYPVVPYTPNEFYYKNGQAYILEQGDQPRSGESIHYHIVEKSSRSFTDAYLPNKFWVYEPLTGNYVKALEDEPNENVTYYNIITYGNTFWDSPQGALSNTETTGRSFLPYLSGFYYFIVDVNGVSYPILDTNNIPGNPDIYNKTSDTAINPNQTYYIYNSSLNIYEEVLAPSASNLENYYVKLHPTSYYYYKLGDEPTLGMTLDGQLTVTYQVESEHEITTLAFGETRTINGVTYTPGSSPMYYYDEDGNFIRVTLEFLKSRDESFFDLNFNTNKYGGCWFIKPVDKTNDIFVPNKYYVRNDENSITGVNYQLATQTIYENHPDVPFYEIMPYKVVQTSKNGFYAQGQYYYREDPSDDSVEPLLDNNPNPAMEAVTLSTVETYNSNHSFDNNLDMVGIVKYYYSKTIDEDTYYPPDWLSDTLTEDTYYAVKGAYYKKAALAIAFDATGEAPAYYRWLEEYQLVPWKFDLVNLSTNPALIKMEGFNNGSSSLHGQLLSLHNLLSLEDEYTRDPNTVQGALNQVQDKFYTLGEFTPGHIMYVNNYGRLTSSPLTHAELLASVNNNGTNSTNHTHSNKSELDLINSGDVAKWNAKQNAIPANTYDVYGAAAAVIGESTDDKTDLTLYGLLAYIDELEQRIAALEPTPEPEPEP